MQIKNKYFYKIILQTLSILNSTNDKNKIKSTKYRSIKIKFRTCKVGK